MFHRVSTSLVHVPQSINQFSLYVPQSINQFSLYVPQSINQFSLYVPQSIIDEQKTQIEQLSAVFQRSESVMRRGVRTTGLSYH